MCYLFFSVGISSDLIGTNHAQIKCQCETQRLYSPNTLASSLSLSFNLFLPNLFTQSSDVCTEVPRSVQDCQFGSAGNRCAGAFPVPPSLTLVN
jgi:hypothetical protein